MNSPAKHTPGEWVVNPAPADASFAIDSVGHGSIATATCRSECEANARLIAAAPDLLEAVTFAIKWNSMRFEKGLSTVPLQLHDALKKAQAKAIGGAQ